MKRKKAPNLSTFRKIQELGFYREQCLKEHGKPPLFTPACQRVVIAPRTVKRNAPELAEQWKNTDFHWYSPNKSKHYSTPPGSGRVKQQ